MWGRRWSSGLIGVSANQCGGDGLLLRMTNDKQAIDSGARQVEEREHLGAGETMPKDVAAEEVTIDEEPLKTELGELTLAMFEQGQSVRVRVGNAHNSSEMYEKAFDSADEANAALLDAGIVKKAITPEAGKSVVLTGLTVEQLEEAGLKRHGTSTL